MLVKDLELDQTLEFISTDFKVEKIKKELGCIAKEFDSFFVRMDNEEYTKVYGMRGIVPYLNKSVEQLVPPKLVIPRRKRYYKVRIFLEGFVIKADEYSAREAREKAIALACQHYCLDLNEPIKVETEEITKEEFNRDFED